MCAGQHSQLHLQMENKLSAEPDGICIAELMVQVFVFTYSLSYTATPERMIVLLLLVQLGKGDSTFSGMKKESFYCEKQL